MRLPPFPSRRRAADEASGSGAASPVFDAAALARLRELDPDGQRGFVSQVLSTYERSLERHLVRLSAGADGTPDVKLAGEVAHTLKSSSASVGALEFARRCVDVERLAKVGQNGELVPALQALLAEGERVLVAVRAMLAP